MISIFTTLCLLGGPKRLVLSDGWAVMVDNKPAMPLIVAILCCWWANNAYMACYQLCACDLPHNALSMAHAAINTL